MVKHLFEILVIIAVIVGLLSIDIAPVFATIYAVDSGSMGNSGNYGSLAGYGRPNLVRWPTGVLHTTYTKMFGAAAEVYWAYSVDNGLNWTPVKITNIGATQLEPVIALSSNGDLHIAWSGLGTGAFPAMYSIIYIHGDYNPATGIMTWGTYEVIDGSNVNFNCYSPEIHIDGNDNIFLTYAIDDAGAETLNLHKKTFNVSLEVWSSWSTAELVSNNVEVPYGYSAAVDQDGKIGIAYERGGGVNDIYFHLRQATGTWNAEELVVNLTNIETPVVMASISGGTTVWRCVWSNITASRIGYSQKTGEAGAWIAATNIGATAPSRWTLSLAQEHGAGYDTGNFYVSYKGTGAFQNNYYIKYILGVGWQAPQSFDTVNNYTFMSATKSLFPMTDSGSAWYWNLPISGFVCVYLEDIDGGGWSNDEQVLYYETVAGWTTSRPLVWTSYPQPTGLNYTTGNGTIVMTGGYDCTVRGFQYGLTMTPTWTSNQAGTFSTGEFGWQIPGLTSGTAYYMRAYATNALGTGYGRWIGFLTAGSGGSYPAGGVQVATTAATLVTTTTATVNGNIIDTGTSACSYRGFEWGEDTTYGNLWTEASAGWPVGAFSHPLTGLYGGNTYHFRAIAYNASGWSYGADMTFTTTTIPPTITTKPATYISMYTARLNSLVTDDGGEASEVRFQYTDMGAWTDNDSPWLPGYITGNKPYADITGLFPNTEYCFRAQIANSAGTYSNGNLTFTTLGAINGPGNFTAIPKIGEPTIDLSWVRGEGSAATMVRYKLGEYPGNTTDGYLVCLRVDSSWAHESLIPGTTYYYRAWGWQGNETSVSYASAMATTTASGAVTVPTSKDMPVSWFFDVDHTRLANLPLYTMFDMGFTDYGIPPNTGWFLVVMFIITAAGMAVYGVGQTVRGEGVLAVTSTAGTQNMVLALGVMILLMAMAAGMRAVPGLYAVLYCIATFGLAVVVRRM